MKRWPAGLAALLVVCAPVAAQAEKVPTDEGLRVTLSPNVTKMRVGQVVDFSLRYTDDDAVSAEVDLSVESVGGTRMAGDGSCATPIERHPNSGGALARAKFKKPGKYVVRGVVTTSTCYGQLNGAGNERVTVTRTITVVR
jgi:hypothetical protein